MLWLYVKFVNLIPNRNIKVDFETEIFLCLFNIKPNNIFSIYEAKVLSYNLRKDENYNFEICVLYGNNIETVNLNCDFITAKSSSLLVNDKTYAKNISSNHNILELVICKNNDMFSSKNIVTKGNLLIKFAFVSKESSHIYHFEKLVSLEECKLLGEIVTNCLVIENDEEIQKISAQETWFAKLGELDNFKKNSDNETNSNKTVSSIENYIYKANENIFDIQIANSSKVRSSISGDNYNIS